MSGARGGIVKMALAASLWGTWSIFLRWSGLSGLTCGALFMTVLAVSGLPSQWRNRHRERPLSAWLWMLLFGVLDSGNTGFFFLAVLHGPISAATLSHYLAPVLTPLVAFLLLKERPSRRTYPAAAIGLAGLWLLMRPAEASSAEASSHLLVTCAYGAASAVFYSTMAPFGKKLGPYFTPLEVTGIHSWLSAAILWGALFLWAPPDALPLAAAAKIVLGSIVCGIVGGSMFYSAVREIPAGLAAVLTYFEPLVATAIGALVFHEAVGPTALLGAGFVLAGGIFLAAETVRRQESPATVAI